MDDEKDIFLFRCEMISWEIDLLVFKQKIFYKIIIITLQNNKSNPAKATLQRQLLLSEFMYSDSFGWQLASVRNLSHSLSLSYHKMKYGGPYNIDQMSAVYTIGDMTKINNAWCVATPQLFFCRHVMIISKHQATSNHLVL